MFIRNRDWKWIPVRGSDLVDLRSVTVEPVSRPGGPPPMMDPFLFPPTGDRSVGRRRFPGGLMRVLSLETKVGVWVWVWA